MNEPTASQKHIIQFPYKPGTTLKVVAGPGSGKTYTLLCKIRQLIETGQVKPSEIIVLSLTNKAVDNIIDNLVQVFEESNEGAYTSSNLEEIVSQVGVYTIHGLSSRIVTENVGIVSIIEENGWRGLVKLIPNEYWKSNNVNILNDRVVSKKLQQIFTDYQSKTDRKDDTIEKILRLMKDSNVLTNDDLTKLAAEYLKKPVVSTDNSFTSFVLNEAKVLIIDEFQDLHPGLLPLLEGLLGSKQLIIFGDVNQSIYEFLGSNETVISQIDTLRPNDQNFTKYIYDNFRCTPEIITASHMVLGLDRSTRMHNEIIVTKNPSRVNPVINHFDELIEEMDFLVSEVSRLVCSSVKLSDIAILTTTNAHSKAISDHLLTFGIPTHKLTSQPDWMSDQRIRFMIDILQLVASIIEEASASNSRPGLRNTKSDFGVIVTLAAVKGVGSAVLQRLHAAALSHNLSIWQFLTTIPSDEWGLQPVMRKKVHEYLEVILSMVSEPSVLSEQQPSKFLKRYSEVIRELDIPLFTCQDSKELQSFRSNLNEFYCTLKASIMSKPDDQSMAKWFLESFHDQSIIYHNLKHSSQASKTTLGAINVSTVHSAKGLEFPVVFLMGRQHYKNLPMDTKVLYVAMTRARNLLYLTNVHHPCVSLLPGNKCSIFENHQFWNYYNSDLKRYTPHNSIPFEIKYNKLQKQFGLTAQRFIYTAVSRLRVLKR